jgi:hypothetical protein
MKLPGFGSSTLLLAIYPILRFSGTMSDCQYPESRTANDERDVVGERTEIDPPIPTRTNPVKAGMLGHPKNAAIRLILEALTKALPRLLVVRNGSRNSSLASGTKMMFTGQGVDQPRS